MNTEQSLAKRIEELKGAAQKARLEAMKLAAMLVTKSDSLLAGLPSNAPRDPTPSPDQGRGPADLAAFPAARYA